MAATQIPPPRMQLLDPRTGLVTREWYLWFLNLYNLTGSGGSTVTLDDLQIGPADTLALEDAFTALRAYAETLPFASSPASQTSDPAPVYAPLTPPDDVAPVPQPVWGATGSFTTADAKTVSVVNGVIVSIV